MSIQPKASHAKTKIRQDKNSLITTDFDTKTELINNYSNNLTHGYYKYEQGQGNIIVKDRLKNHYHFGELLDVMIIYWTLF